MKNCAVIGLFFTIALVMQVSDAGGQNRYPVLINGKYGFIDKHGDLKIDAIYDDLIEFKNDLALYTDSNLITHVIDTNGLTIKSFKGNYEKWMTGNPVGNNPYRYTFNDNLLAVFDTLTHQYGYIGKDGTWRIPPRFPHVSDFHEGLASVGFWDNNPDHLRYNFEVSAVFLDSVKLGFIDTTGSLVIDTMYYRVSDFEMGLSEVATFSDYQSGVSYFINQAGKKVNTDSISDYLSFCRVQKVNKDFVYQKYGKYVIGLSYYNSCGIAAREFFNGINSSGYYGFVDCNNEWVIPPLYQNVNAFMDGYAGVQKKMGEGIFLWGYINCYGKMVVDYQYEFAGPFSKGLAAVCKNDKWGVIDTNNNIVIPFEYENACSPFCRFEGDLIHFYKDGVEYYLNRQGEVVWKGD